MDVFHLPFPIQPENLSFSSCDSERPIGIERRLWVPRTPQLFSFRPRKLFSSSSSRLRFSIFRRKRFPLLLCEGKVGRYLHFPQKHGAKVRERYSGKGLDIGQGYGGLAPLYVENGLVFFGHLVNASSFVFTLTRCVVSCLRKPISAKESIL